MANVDHLSVGVSIWDGVLTFLGGFFLLIVRKLWVQLDGKADKDDMETKLGAIREEIERAENRQDTRHVENIGRLDHITERIDTLINRTGGKR